MRILFDARSVRTPAGLYVLRGLVKGWLDDSRVEEVIVATPRAAADTLVVAGTTPAILRDDSGWFAHLWREVSALADAHRADIIFSPNALPPRDSRSILYFQDLYQFRTPASDHLSAEIALQRLARRVWYAVAAGDCKLAVPVSSAIAREVSQRLSLPIAVIPNGVDVGAYRWSGEMDQIFVLGGIGERKGEALALRAWARVPANIRGDTRLVIGGVSSGERMERLAELGRTLGVHDSVRIVGHMPRDQYLAYVVASRFSISCTMLEAFGLPVAETLAIGAPIICTDIPAHVELTERAGAGVTFAVGSEAELAARLSEALDGDLPRRMAGFPADWSWADRARQHVDAYLRHS